MHAIATLTERLIEFAETGNQQKIILSDGRVIQGWVMEVNPDGIQLSSGYGDKNGTEQWLNYQQLEGARFEYFDSQQQQWRPFTLYPAEQ